MHQLRIQAALRGWPIQGDGLYGATQPFSDGPQRIIGLHGRSLVFLHPIRFEPITLTAPLPQSWRQRGIVEPVTE